jgi:phosphatidylserine synthase
VIVKHLCIPPRSPHAYFIHLITAFFISGFFHFLSLSVICEGYVEPMTLALNMGLFFIIQPFGTMVEYAVIQLCQGTRWSEYLITRTDSERSVFDGVPQLLVRTLGYVWVFCWFIWTGWWFVEVYAAIGVLEWSMPISLWPVENKGI